MGNHVYDLNKYILSWFQQESTNMVNIWHRHNISHDMSIEVWTNYHDNFILTFPQKEHVYFPCCVISIFLMVFLREAPYLVPYLPQIPTFLVRFA